MAPDDSWFRRALLDLYGSLCDPASAISLSRIIHEGYHNEELRIHLDPMEPLSVGDLSGFDVGMALPGGCMLNFTNGNCDFSGTGTRLNNLSALGRGPTGMRFLADDDSVFTISFTFAEVRVEGSMTLHQPCKDRQGKPCSAGNFKGRYSVNARGVEATATVALTLDEQLRVRIHPIDVVIPQIAIDTRFDNAPSEAKAKWWNILANSPQLHARMRATVSQGLANPAVEHWLESLITALVAPILNP